MKIKIITVLCLIVFPLAICYAIDFSDIEKNLKQALPEEALKAAGVDLNSFSRYVNWELINVSFEADMINTTESSRAKATVKSKVFKKDISGIRINIIGGIKIPSKDKSIQLPEVYILQYPLKDDAYLVFPLKNAYMKLDPEKNSEIMGKFKEKMDEKSSKIEKKEILGTEEFDGYVCDKAHVITTLENGTKCDITAWLAKQLNNFPIKMIMLYDGPGNIKGTNITLFKNLKKTEPDSSLFDIPEGYKKCENIIELSTGGKIGSNINKRNKRGKLLRKQQE